MREFRLKRTPINGPMLKALRIHRSLPLSALSELMDVAVSTIQRWEMRRSTPTLLQVIKLSKVLKVEVRVLYTNTSSLVWAHMESVVLLHVLEQMEIMESGEVPDLDLNQFSGLCDKLGVFSVESADKEEITEAQRQLEKLIS